MLRIAWRSITTRLLRTAVLAGGFGFGIGVMAALLGVGEVVLDQAHAPALQGGGDLVVAGAFGSVESARFVQSSVLGGRGLKDRIAAVAPSARARLFLIGPHGATAVSATGGVPSLERAMGDPEIAGIAGWRDAPADARWSRPDPGDVLRAMDRFHPIPDVPARAASWAEWLYFNGHSADGRLRFYLTFLVGPRSKASAGRRVAGVRLQLEQDGRSASYTAGGEVDEAALLAGAPDLAIAGSRVHLDGLKYEITLALDGADGTIVLDAAPGRSLPPTTLRGADGWISGYVAPVLSGTAHGRLRTAAGPVVFDDVAGYHDHNWGFWKDVRWQWGQVAHGDLSILYGRVFPPAEVADPDRVPGFLAVLGHDGPVAFSTDVRIAESGEPGRLHVRARGAALDLELVFAADETVRTAMGGGPRFAAGGGMDFLQLSGPYHVTGRIGDDPVDFSARGAAETFRPR